MQFLKNLSERIPRLKSDSLAALLFYVIAKLSALLMDEGLLNLLIPFLSTHPNIFFLSRPWVVDD